MARTLAYIHERRIIVADIASRNFLLDSGLSIKLCDFTESIQLPLDTCMEKADFDGYSIRTDIGQLGCVMYEVIVGEKCKFDIFKDIPPELSRGRWPRREDLPSTQGIWLGATIDKCWTEGAFTTALDLCQELEKPESRTSQMRYCGHPATCYQWSSGSPCHTVNTVSAIQPRWRSRLVHLRFILGVGGIIESLFCHQAGHR